MKYVKINIPVELAEKIKPYLRENGGVYRGYSEFAVEAVRLRLQQLEERNLKKGEVENVEGDCV